jgi:hypothetical protein
MTLSDKTPFDIYQRIVRSISLDRLSWLRRDQQLLSEGWTLHFAIDPYDIIEFCFPFRPTGDLMRQFRIEWIDEISKGQNGRYEVIYNLSTKPILLDTYLAEMDSIQNWLSWSKYVKTNSDELENYFLQLQVPLDSQPEETRQILLELTKKHINSVIAIVTGMASWGAGRLAEVLQKRLVRGQPEIPGLRHIKLKKRVHVAEIIYQKFQEYFEREYWSKRRSPRAQKKLRRKKELIEASNSRDAEAIDQILELNEHLNKHKHLILYFSSSMKSSCIPESERLRDYLPCIGGTPYNILRTSEELFAYMIYRGESKDKIQRAQVTVDRLMKLEQVLEKIKAVSSEFEKANENCDSCLHGGSVKCEFSTFCDEVREYGKSIETNREKHVNMALHRNLAQTLEGVKQLPKDKKYRPIFDHIREISNNMKKNVSAQEFEVTLQACLTKANFVSDFVVHKHREKDTEVSCDLNYYPIRLKLVDKEIESIYSELTDMLGKVEPRDEDFMTTVGEYLKLDAERVEDAQSELLRCFIYLLMQESGRSIAICERFLSKRDIEPEVAQEFLYLLCFSLNQDERFKEAVDRASAGLSNSPNDGRFFHFRSHALYSLWNDTKNKEASQPQDVIGDSLKAASQLQDVIGDSLKAADFFCGEKDTIMCAATLNNLAFFYSWEKLDICDLGRSHEYLSQLQNIFPEEKWYPYPEFFHTKGSVLYLDYLKTENMDMLEEAALNALKALKLYKKKKQHNDLVEMITQEAARKGMKGLLERMKNDLVEMIMMINNEDEAARQRMNDLVEMITQTAAQHGIVL